MPKSIDSFKSHLSNIVPIPEKEWARILGYLSTKRYKSKELIHPQGKAFDKIMFLYKGLARSYLINHEGRDFTWSIHFNDAASNIKNIFITDYASFIKSEPSALFFEALEDTEVIVINKNDINSLYSVSHYWANMGRIISESAYYFTHHRTLSLLSKSAKERYISLAKENPSFLRIVPQYYVASYLGITPQSLSRIKKELQVIIC